MREKLIRLGIVLVLVLSASGAGYAAGSGGAAAVAIPAETVAAPASGSVRLIYSLDKRQNDKELIALIDGAKKFVYFAIYEFTLSDVADALIAAKERGVDVRGVVDAGESSKSYGRPIIERLVSAGIPIETQHHADGNGIMHIKALVTDSAYAMGSYNWTNSATKVNDELLEIGTDEDLRQAYENILLKLLSAYAGTVAAAEAAASVSIGTIPFSEAPKHVGQTASVTGTLVSAYTSASGTVFLDFCKSYKTCPFSGVIFADDVKAFGDLSKYEGRAITVTGRISSYQGRAEIVLSDRSQLR